MLLSVPKNHLHVNSNKPLHHSNHPSWLHEETVRRKAAGDKRGGSSLLSYEQSLPCFLPCSALTKYEKENRVDNPPRDISGLHRRAVRIYSNFKLSLLICLLVDVHIVFLALLAEVRVRKCDYFCVYSSSATEKKPLYLAWLRACKTNSLLFTRQN